MTFVGFANSPGVTTVLILSDDVGVVPVPVRIVVVAVPVCTPNTPIGGLVALYVPQISASAAPPSASWLSPPKMNWTPALLVDLVGLWQEPGITGEAPGEAMMLPLLSTGVPATRLPLVMPHWSAAPPAAVTA